MTSPSGATGVRRNRLWNSRTRDPPVTVYHKLQRCPAGWLGGWMVVLAAFRVTWISCIFVGTSALGFGFALVTGKFIAIRRLTSAGFTWMMRAIFTSPLELMSHHLASTLNRAIPLESPDSNTMVGQPALGRKRGVFFFRLYPLAWKNRGRNT